MNGMISRRVGGLEYRDGHLGNQWDAQIYTSLPPREGVWPVGGRASGYTPSLVPPRGGATSCLPRQLHLLDSPVPMAHSGNSSRTIIGSLPPSSKGATRPWTL